MASDLRQAGPDAGLEPRIRPVRGVLIILTASHCNISRERDQEYHLAALQELQQRQGVLEEHVQAVLACKDEVSFHVVLPIDKLADG